MYEVPSAMMVHDTFDALPALVIPYHNLNGHFASSHPKWPDFYRLRYLAKGNSFKDLATDKSQRYAQPPHSGVCAYFPCTENWEKISKDTAQGLIFTEGEFKAAAACDNGFPTIGLGGVWNFMAQREGLFFLPELEKVDWRKRPVWICFRQRLRHERQRLRRDEQAGRGVGGARRAAARASAAGVGGGRQDRAGRLLS
jgi:hypothetical protein